VIIASPCGRLLRAVRWHKNCHCEESFGYAQDKLHDEAISEMSLTMRLRRSFQSLAMTIRDNIRCKLFIAIGSNCP